LLITSEPEQSNPKILSEEFYEQGESVAIGFMNIIADLVSTQGLRIGCPNCEEDFPARRAHLFDATLELPTAVLKKVEEHQMAISAERSDLRLRRKLAKERPAIGARAARIGKVVEKIATTLPGFPVRGADCRSLFEPIDYLVFHGLSTKGKIEMVEFVDVKSGGGSLTPRQKLIRAAVERGRTSLLVTELL
jgi:predicted Holliday junction resolvase-like endonuclease